MIYETGPWLFEEIKDVPDSVAMKMLTHVDVYARPAVDPTAPVQKVVPTPPKEDPLQDFYDALRMMTRQQALDFIDKNFHFKLDMSQFPTDQSARDHARMLVEQYGLAP